MTLEETIAELFRLGISLKPVRPPSTKITASRPITDPELIDAIRAHRDDLRDALIERVAVRIADGNVPESHAELICWDDVLRQYGFDPAHIPF